MESNPQNITLYAVSLPEDFRIKVDAMAKEASLLPSEILLRLAMQGLRCGENKHDDRLVGK